MAATEARNRHGWLRVSELIAGRMEQSAIRKDGVFFSITLSHDPTGDDFVVTIAIQDGGDGSTARHAFGTDIGRARRVFGILGARVRKGELQ